MIFFSFALCSLLRIFLLQLLAYTGYYRACAAKQNLVQTHSEESLAKAKELLAGSIVKYTKLNKVAKEDLPNLLEEMLKIQGELIQDFSSKMLDLGVSLIAMTSANEVL